MLETKYGKTIWFPRVLAIAFSLILAAFYFSPISSMTKDLSAIITGILPSVVSLAMIILTWRKPKYCGYYFIIFAVAFALYFAYKKYNDSFAYAVMAGVPVIIGGQFILLGTKRPTKKAKAAVKEEATPEIKPEVIAEESVEAKTE
jgi:hypothetical protein